jgi:hypothetical protein
VEVQHNLQLAQQVQLIKDLLVLETQETLETEAVVVELEQ